MILRYAITDPNYYGSTPKLLKKSCQRVLSSYGIDIITLRDKDSSDYEALAKEFLSLKPLYPNTLFFLHTRLDLAYELEADGIHLPSSMIGSLKEASKYGKKIVVSTHSFSEVEACKQNGAYGVTYGPIFDTPGKGAPKGLEKLKEITGKIDINIFALGGITSKSHVEAVSKAGAAGFASIRYFLN